MNFSRMKSANRASFSRQRAFSLVEVMVSAAVSMLVFGSILVTLSAQQRGFVAALYQMDCQADESRVMAYLSKDLRNASAIQLQAAGTQATLTIPGQSSFSFNLNLGLPLLSLLSPAGSTTPPTTVQYYRQGTSILRQVNGVASCLTKSATNFTVSQSGSLARVDLSFQPRFSLGSGTSAAGGAQVTTYVYLINAGQL